MSKDTAGGNGLSVAGKSGVPDQCVSGVVGTMLVVMEQSGGLVVSWLSIGSNWSCGNLDGWGGLDNRGGSLSGGFRSWGNSRLWLWDRDDSGGWRGWWWRRGCRGRLSRALWLVLSVDGVLDDDGGVGDGRRDWGKITSSHSHVDDVGNDVGDIGLLVHSLVLDWRSNGDGGTEDSEDS